MTRQLEIISDESLRVQAWEFMQMQAAQRLQTFYFYVVICVALTAGISTGLKPSEPNPWVVLMASLLLMFFSFIFFKLDMRNRFLIQGAEAAIKEFEKTSELENDNGAPHFVKRFLREEHETHVECAKPCQFIWQRHFTYTTCFKCVFWGFSLLGATGTFAAVLTLLF